MNVNGKSFLNAGSILKNSSQVINECVKNIISDMKRYVSLKGNASEYANDISNISDSCDKMSKVAECYSIMADIANGIGDVYDNVEV